MSDYDYRNICFEIPMEKGDAAALGEAVEQLQKALDRNEPPLGWQASRSNPLPGFEQAFPDAGKALPSAKARRAARDLYGRICAAAERDPGLLRTLCVGACAGGLEVSNATAWASIDHAAALIQTAQAHFGVGDLHFEWGEFTPDADDNPYGGGAVVVPAGGETRVLDSHSMAMVALAEAAEAADAEAAQPKGPAP